MKRKFVSDLTCFPPHEHRAAIRPPEKFCQRQCEDYDGCPRLGDKAGGIEDEGARAMPDVGCRNLAGTARTSGGRAHVVDGGCRETGQGGHVVEESEQSTAHTA